MDADGSHQPEQLHRLLDALRDGADLVIGSRWVPGGSVVNWPLRREALSRGGNLYVRLLLGIAVRDATAGFRVFRRSDAGEDRPRPRSSPPATSSRPTWSTRALAGRADRARGADRVRRAGARRLQDERRGGHRVAEAGSPAGACASARDQVRRRSRSPGSARPLMAAPPPAALGVLAARRSFVVVPLVEIYVIIQVGQVDRAVVDDPAAGRSTASSAPG